MLGRCGPAVGLNPLNREPEVIRMGYTKYVKELYTGLRSKYNDPKYKDLRELVMQRKIKWRRGPSIARVEKPTRIDQARKYGYKSKQGIVVVRARVRRGGMRRSRPSRGRTPGGMGIAKITPGKSIQRIAEERVQKRYPNLEVLGSYWLWEDGEYKWFEIVLVDPSHSVIKSDKDLRWITSGKHRRRVYRGLTPAGKTGRGLRNKGKGAEKLRPSLRAHKRIGK